MKKLIYSLFISFNILFLTSCEEFISKSFDNEAIKKLRTENTNLKIQVDKLQRQIRKKEEELVVNDLVISMYDLRHAVEKFALNNNSSYPIAENVVDLTKVVKQYLPKDFSIEMSYLETVKSSEKGYIFIANINNQKIVVSNLI